MAKFYSKCIDSADWVEEISGYRPSEDLITLDELIKLEQSLDCCFPWDYPLNETEMLATQEEYADTYFVLVRFSTDDGDYEYRWCEI